MEGGKEGEGRAKGGNSGGGGCNSRLRRLRTQSKIRGCEGGCEEGDTSTMLNIIYLNKLKSLLLLLLALPLRSSSRFFCGRGALSFFGFCLQPLRLNPFQLPCRTVPSLLCEYFIRAEDAAQYRAKLYSLFMFTRGPETRAFPGSCLVFGKGGLCWGDNRFPEKSSTPIPLGRVFFS